jgi:hypothetical protein
VQIKKKKKASRVGFGREDENDDEESNSALSPMPARRSFKGTLSENISSSLAQRYACFLLERVDIIYSLVYIYYISFLSEMSLIITYKTVERPLLARSIQQIRHRQQ